MSEGDRFIAMKTMVNMKYKFGGFFFIHSDWVCDSDGAICDGKTFCSSKCMGLKSIQWTECGWEKKVESLQVCSFISFSPNNEKLHKSISRIFVDGKSNKLTKMNDVDDVCVREGWWGFGNGGTWTYAQSDWTKKKKIIKNETYENAHYMHAPFALVGFMRSHHLREFLCRVFFFIHSLVFLQNFFSLSM